MGKMELYTSPKDPKNMWFTLASSGAFPVSNVPLSETSYCPSSPLVVAWVAAWRVGEQKLCSPCRRRVLGTPLFRSAPLYKPRAGVKSWSLAGEAWSSLRSLGKRVWYHCVKSRSWLGTLHRTCVFLLRKWSSFWNEIWWKSGIRDTCLF